MKAKEESEKVGLKLNIQKTKIMASGPITSWQIDWETVEMVADFIFLGCKITADGDCSHEIKRCLLLGRKAMTRHYFVNKGPSSQGYGFSCGHVCESWTIKKAEHRRIGAFKLQYWRRLLRFPRIAKRSNQDILKKISTECSLEGPILKLTLQYFGHLMRRGDSFKKTLMLGKIEGRRRSR